MATLKSAAVATGQQSRAGVGVEIAFASYELVAALALNDVIQMVKIPAGATVCELLLATDDLDTGGSPALVLDVGDGDDTDRYIDGSTIGQTGGSARLGSGVSAATAANSFNYTYAAEDTIDVLAQVAPATGATSGTVSLMVIYTMQKSYQS